VLGVDGIHHHGLLIRVWIKTVPLQQWKVAREFRRRVKIAFDECQIQIGAPQQIWISSNDQEIANLPDALTVGKDPDPGDAQGNTSTVIGKV
jgi:small conductance mechanosensitive channel